MKFKKNFKKITALAAVMAMALSITLFTSDIIYLHLVM